MQEESVDNKILIGYFVKQKKKIKMSGNKRDRSLPLLTNKMVKHLKKIKVQIYMSAYLTSVSVR